MSEVSRQMDERERDAFLRRMEEASVLDASDPVRVALLREVVEAGEWAEQRWVGLAAEGERLRLGLVDVVPPAGLGDRLRGLIDAEGGVVDGAAGALSGDVGLGRAGLGGGERGDGGYVLPRWVYGLAAVLVMGVCVVMVVMVSGRGIGGGMGGGEVDRHFQTLGVLAVDHYLHEPAVVTSDPRVVEERLSGVVGFEVSIPVLGDGFELMGATPCKLGGHEVVCTQWMRNGMYYRMYQFLQGDFELPVRFDRREVEASGPWGAERGKSVTFWTEGDRGYAMLEVEGLGPNH